MPLLARHFLECGDLRKALPYAVQAAEQAESLFAHEEALRHYERARACAEDLNLADQLAAIDEGIGDVYFRRGPFDRAVESYQRASASTANPDSRAALKFKIGRVYAQFSDQRGLEFLDTALAELNSSTQRKERAQATALLGRYQHYDGHHGTAIQLLEEALRLAEPLDDAETFRIIYLFLAGACYHMGRPEASMEWARRCIELGERAQDPLGVAVGFEFFAENLNLLGKWGEALDFSAREYEIAKQIGSEIRLAWVEFNRANALHEKGELSAAAASARAGLMFAERTGEKRIAVLLRTWLVMTETDLASDEAAQRNAHAGVANADALGERMGRAISRHALAYFHLQRGEWQAAEALFDQMRGLLAGSDNRAVRIFSSAPAAEVAWGGGRLDHAAKMVVEALELARDSRSRYYEARALRVQGQILASQELGESASRAFDDAIVILEELGSRLEMGRGLYHRGLLRRALGQRDAAQADLVHAHAIFAETGAQRDRERVEIALR